ncbi:MAG: molybdopterin-dependent oxidoreductase [Desulfohalobiaceae bacterium]|nr:molybdopterin-dependent oxidoreductase [Desulfohalobiaceae bacterium]
MYKDSSKSRSSKVSEVSPDLPRRSFLKAGALVGGCAALLTQSESLAGLFTRQARAAENDQTYVLARPENYIYTTCLQCHVACQLKTKFWDGALAKISGSPYSPQTYLPHIPYETRPEDTAPIDGKICPAAQTGIQTYYDPYRIRKVLKRDGERGSNKWKSIPFDQFLEEVAEGGKLFDSIGDNRRYPGFKEVVALRDAKLSRQMADDADRVGSGTLSIQDFQKKYKKHLDKLVDPEHPDLGPKNNGFVFMAGRIEHGRKELMKWFTNKAVGSTNAYEHTTICEQSHHRAYSMMTGHANHHMKPDLVNCEFVLFWGTGAYTANFGKTPMAEKVTSGKVQGRLKTAVVDPRMSNDAAHADWWLPVKPEENTTLAMAMIRWILENRRYDQGYLENANKAAAEADAEPTWTNSTHLVKVVDGHPLELLRASEADIGTDQELVVSRNGKLIPVDPDDTAQPVEGDLFVDITVGSTPVKSGFQLLSEEAFSSPMSDYSSRCGIKTSLIAEVARELTSHGKRAVVEMYRGPVQHPDGYFAGCAIITLNMLLGNADYKGGLIEGGGHWHEWGGKPGNVYDFSTMHPGALTAFGPKISREGSKYEDFSLYREQGYPAKRPWYPFTGNVYQEVIPSFADGYPYPGKILFTHKGTPALAIPGGNQQIIEMLKNPDRVPLFIASDIVIGETSMYADYILPDLTFLERWGTPHVTPDVPTRTSKVRQPAAQPLTETVEVDGEQMPLCMEAFLIGVAKRLKLSGFGKNAFGPGMGFDKPEDWFLKPIANIAYGDKKNEAVPSADDQELALFIKARRHLPSAVFDPKRWKKALRSEEEWRKVLYVLNRGGRYHDYGLAYGQTTMRYHTFGGMFHLFVEEVARQKNSMSGKYFHGIPKILGEFDCRGKSLEHSKEFPFRLITYKEPHGGQSRTISNYWGNIALQPENKILINAVDAGSLGLKQDQQVRMISQDNPDGRLDLMDGDGRVLNMVGRVKIVQGMRPGTVAVSWHYGHWAYGANEVVVDGERIQGDTRRGAGLCPNHLMRVDPVLKNVCLTDPIGGSASFNSTMVNLTKV